jgi:hypothetical protein
MGLVVADQWRAVCPQLAVWAAQSDASFCWQRPIGSVAMRSWLLNPTSLWPIQQLNYMVAI